ncbi:MAG: hypothetical protein MJ214_00540 [Bacilli bacterium]|nr:hypothetical protein [Bacilli bacterium]
MYDLKFIKEQIANHKIISFDIFDTLILRPFMKPTDLFLYIEDKYKLKGFHKARIKAERKARIHSLSKEITIEDIYSYIPEKFKHIKNEEIACESKLNLINPIGHELFQYAKKLNKTIIIVSDMYLSSIVLSRLLATNKIIGYKKMYVSSEIGITKNSAKLFKFVVEDNKCNAKDILHIGDLYYADVYKAKSVGLDAILLQAPRKALLKDNQKFRSLYRWNKKSLAISIYLAIISQFMISSKKDDYWYDFGFTNGGPIILSFMMWLSDKLDANKINDVAFIARDGYTLKRIFDLITNHKYNSHYLYAPRKINVLINLDYQSSDMYKSKKRELRALNSIFDYFKNEVPINNNSRFTYLEAMDFFNKHKEEYKKLSENKKKDYLSYLNKCFKKDKVAVVDTTTSNFSSQNLLSAVDKNRSYIGSYFQVFSSKSKKRSHPYISFHKHIIHFAYRWEIMEFLMSAPEAPIIDVIGGKAIFKSANESEKVNMQIYPAISEGALKFAEIFKKIFDDSYLNVSCEDLIEWINHFVAYPNRLDISNFTKVSISKDFQHNTYCSMFGNWSFRKYLFRALNIIMFAKVRNKLFRLID